MTTTDYTQVRRHKYSKKVFLGSGSQRFPVFHVLSAHSGQTSSVSHQARIISFLATFSPDGALMLVELVEHVHPSCLYAVCVWQHIPVKRLRKKCIWEPLGRMQLIWFFFLSSFYSFYFSKAVIGRIIEQHNVAFSVYNACNFNYWTCLDLFLKDFLFSCLPIENCFLLKFLTEQLEDIALFI